jgi:catechol 2,3-dioxygenase-like lactoylglutathione lyase family enzyme
MISLNQITVPSNNLSLSIDFYQKLGMELIVHSTDHYARFVVPKGESTFSVHVTEDLLTDSGIWVYFEVEDLDDYVRSLISKGLNFDELPNDKPWLWREARIKDPFNNQIILYYAGENRLNPPWRIKKKE